MPETRAGVTLVWLLCLIDDALALMGNFTSHTEINSKVSSLLEMLTSPVLQKEEGSCKELATMLDTLKDNIVNSFYKLARNIYLNKRVYFLMLEMKRLNSHYRIYFEVNVVT